MWSATAQTWLLIYSARLIFSQADIELIQISILALDPCSAVFIDTNKFPLCKTAARAARGSSKYRCSVLVLSIPGAFHSEYHDRSRRKGTKKMMPWWECGETKRRKRKLIARVYRHSPALRRTCLLVSIVSDSMCAFEGPWGWLVVSTKEIRCVLYKIIRRLSSNTL